MSGCVFKDERERGLGVGGGGRRGGRLDSTGYRVQCGVMYYQCSELGRIWKVFCLSACDCDG